MIVTTEKNNITAFLQLGHGNILYIPLFALGIFLSFRNVANIFTGASWARSRIHTRSNLLTAMSTTAMSTAAT